MEIEPKELYSNQVNGLSRHGPSSHKDSSSSCSFIGYLPLSATSQSVQATPPRFWHFFEEDDFIILDFIASGNFGEVKRAQFKTAEFLEKQNRNTTHANEVVALKDPQNREHDYILEQYSLSHEMSCTILFHNNLVNYFGGVDFGEGTISSPQRVGIVMEYVVYNLECLIRNDCRLLKEEIQLHIAKQISLGMNFLHSLKPCVLVKTNFIFSHFA